MFSFKNRKLISVYHKTKIIETIKTINTNRLIYYSYYKIVLKGKVCAKTLATAFGGRAKGEGVRSFKKKKNEWWLDKYPVIGFSPFLTRCLKKCTHQSVVRTIVPHCTYDQFQIQQIISVFFKYVWRNSIRLKRKRFRFFYVHTIYLNVIKWRL